MTGFEWAVAQGALMMAGSSGLSILTRHLDFETILEMSLIRVSKQTTPLPKIVDRALFRKITSQLVGS